MANLQILGLVPQLFYLVDHLCLSGFEALRTFLASILEPLTKFQDYSHFFFHLHARLI